MMNGPKAMKRKPLLPARAWGLLLLGLLLSPLAVRAADLDPLLPLSQYGMDTWDGADGLPQFRIRAVLQTRDGYLWLGTANGLVRFDGIDFTTFDTSNCGLRDNEISSLLEDDGGLWIGTYGGGLARLKDGQFTSYTTTNGLPNDSIRRLDKDPAGNLWIATPSGIARLANGSFTTYTRTNGLPDDFIIGVCAHSPQGIFVMAGGRLNQLAGDRFVPVPGVIEDGDSRADNIASGKDGALWMTFENGTVKRWKDGKVTTYTRRDHHHDRLSAIYADPQGTVWFAAHDGPVRFANGKFESLDTAEARTRLGLVLSMVADSEGDLWLGTEANGLARLRSMPVRILTVQDGLPENSTRCIYRDRQDDIWVGTYVGYAHISQGKITAYTRLESNAIPTVTAIGEDATGRIWLGAGGQLYVRQNEQLEPVPGWKKVFDIKVISRDAQGNMWVGTDGDGLVEISGGGMKSYRAQDGLANNQIRAILCDRQGALWVGTTEGLNRFQDGKFTTFKLPDGVANNRILSLHEDSEGVLWVSTRGGLCRFQNGKFFNFREAQGLPDRFIFNVLDDGQGGFWLSSGKGIHRVAKADLNAVAAGVKSRVSVVSVGYREGLRSASLVAGTQPNACLDPAGRLLFCSLRGIVQISPGTQTINSNAPPVFIESVRINQSPQPVNRVAEIPPGAGEVEIHYTGLSYVAPEKVRFKYRLEGIDAGWIDAGARRFAHYASLPPGDYRFHVIACNNDGVWNETGATCAFRLIPHFYQTRWFLPLVFLLIAGLAAAAYGFRIRQLRANERKLQRRVDEAVAQVKVLSGLLPICSGCKKVRDDHGYWNQIEQYIMRHAEVEFSHSLCPDCLKRLYPEEADDVLRDMNAAGDKKKPGQDPPPAGLA
jgi:ligand-binding sensor domain-containing protein